MHRCTPRPRAHADRRTFPPVCWLAVFIACLLYTGGCRGGGRIELASLNFRAIDPPVAPSPRVARIELDRCCWWTDQDDRLWIAMQRRQTPYLNPKLRLHFQMSLALKKLPAGPARDYRVDENTLRACVRLGPWESRFTARRGVIALYRESGDRLRGSLRLEAARVSARWLGGWSRPSRYLLLGSFVAVPDEQRGRAIVEATESAGWERNISARERHAARRSGSASSATTPSASPSSGVAEQNQP